MPVITGKDGEILLNGVRLGETLDWERTVEVQGKIDSTGQSDDWTYNERLHRHWTVRARVELWASTYATQSRGSLVGALVTVVLKVETAGLTWFAGTARLDRETTRAPQEDTVSMECELDGYGAPTVL